MSVANFVRETEADRVERFMGRLVELYNGGALTIMISIGHRTRLFDTLAAMPPSGSVELAERAGLDERYVREWLGAMVTGGIVEYDAERRVYSLPPAHAALLTRAASPSNLAVASQFIPLLGQVEDDVVGCFFEGGGVPYEKFPRFHEVMAEESDQSVVSGLVDSVLPLVPGLRERLERGIRVLDVGCGRAHAIMELAARFPKSSFVGYDLSAEAVAHGNAEARRRGLRNVRLVARDVTRLEEAGTYDLVTAFDAIHDQADPAAVLDGIARAVRSDGTFLMQDISASSHLEKNVGHPLGPYLYTISTLHCMTVSLAQGGAGLGTVWGEELATRMLREAGFRHVAVNKLPHDFMNTWYVARKW